MRDFIDQVAYMISESGDTPSYDDIYTLCKKVGHEPDEETMSKEEYDMLPQEEKDEIHRIATFNVDFSDIDPTVDTEEYWKKFLEWKKKYGIERDENGYPLDWDHTKKKQKVRGEINTILFVCEQYTEWGDKFDFGMGVKGQKSKNPYKKLGQIIFKTKEEAEAEMHKRMDEMVQKFGLDKDKFKRIPDGALPTEIRRADPNAYGFLLDETEGEGKVVHRKRGPQGKNSSGDTEGETTFDKKTKSYFMEYFIYQSKSIIRSSGEALADLADKINDD